MNSFIYQYKNTISYFSFRPKNKIPDRHADLSTPVGYFFALQNMMFMPHDIFYSVLPFITAV